MSSHYDVVVIGAGAAGLAGADCLAQLGGFDVAVVESAQRIGGRCWTDIETFGVPYDVGAHWLHYANLGNLLRHGQQSGFDLYRDPKQLELLNGENSLIYDYRSLKRLLDDCKNQMEPVIQSGKDISVFDALDMQWGTFERETVEFVWGPWVMGKSLHQFSVLDGQSQPEDDDWFCKQGLGTLLAHRYSKVPVSLNTEATEIDWSGKLVKIKTSKGDIWARAVIITVSTGVLSDGGIRFVPSLPVDKTDSFHAISMGNYEHIVLELSDYSLIGNDSDYYVLKIDTASNDAFGALMNISGCGLTFCDVGGRFALDLIEGGKRESIALAIEQLSEIFDTNIKRLVTKADATSWATNRFTKGSYASAAAGCFRYREILRRPIADKIFFAGEACHESMWASVAGAIASGVQTAHESARIVGK